MIPSPPPVGGRFVSITFDDGYIRGARRAVEVLDREGVAATFYVLTGWVRPRRLRLMRRFDGDDRGTWDDWREIEARGHEVGSHTVSHINAAGRLARWIPFALARELAASHRDLRRNLGEGTRTIGMPFNAPPLRALGVLRRCYGACRLGDSVARYNDLRSLDPYALASWAPDSDVSTEEILAGIDATPDGHWLILQFHSLDGEGHMPISAAELETLVRHVAQHPTVRAATIRDVVRMRHRLFPS